MTFILIDYAYQMFQLKLFTESPIKLIDINYLIL